MLVVSWALAVEDGSVVTAVGEGVIVDGAVADVRSRGVHRGRVARRRGLRAAPVVVVVVLHNVLEGGANNVARTSRSGLRRSGGVRVAATIVRAVGSSGSDRRKALVGHPRGDVQSVRGHLEKVAAGDVGVAGAAAGAGRTGSAVVVTVVRVAALGKVGRAEGVGE